MARSKYGKSFDEWHATKLPERRARRSEGSANYLKNKAKQGIAGYDLGAKGSSKFDYRDVKYLRKEGYSDDEISKYASGLGRQQIHEGLRLNKEKFAGKYYEGGKKIKNIADHDVGKGFNMADVAYLRNQGFSDKDIAAHANKMVLESGKRHGNAMSKFMEAQGQLNYYQGDWKKAKEKAQAHQENSNNTNVGDTTITSGSNNQTTINTDAGDLTSTVEAKQEQNVNQDNDINTNIDGNNNVVTNNQDNSIRQYGGDTRIFNYKGGANAGLDTPASMATMAGLYDVNDSASKQAKFTDLFSTLNRDTQKQYGNTQSFAQEAIARARNNESLDINAMDKRIKDREMYSRAKADVMGSNIFGDMFKGSAPNWNSPEREGPVETPDFNKMYEKYSKF